MRLTYVLERYPELSQTFVEDELRELKRQGDEIEVLALAPGEHAELSEPAFEPSYPSSLVPRLAALAKLSARHPRFVAAWSRGAQSWPSDGRHIRGLARVAPWIPQAVAAHHLHAHFATEAADIAALLGRLGGRPHSFTGHSSDLFADDAGLRRRLEQAAFAVLVCEYDRRAVERLAPGVGVLHVIQLGVDLERLRRSTPYDPEGPVVAVGRLVEQKGLADLVSVAGDIDRPVIVAGDGPLRNTLDHGQAELRGALAPEEAAALIEGASVLVAPSVVAEDGSRDGIPMVLKEALALGVPVVASDAVGNPEVVEDGWGALYPAGDRRALAAAIKALLERPAAEREAMGRAGRAFAERELDLCRQTAKLRELFATSASVAST
jgi:colanic acid/amylovoran biosynthesis glycosyltransferase